MDSGNEDSLNAVIKNEKDLYLFTSEVEFYGAEAKLHMHELKEEWKDAFNYFSQAK